MFHHLSPFFLIEWLLGNYHLLCSVEEIHHFICSICIILYELKVLVQIGLVCLNFIDRLLFILSCNDMPEAAQAGSNEDRNRHWHEGSVFESCDENANRSNTLSNWHNHIVLLCILQVLQIYLECLVDFESTVQILFEPFEKAFNFSQVSLHTIYLR